MLKLDLEKYETTTFCVPEFRNHYYFLFHKNVLFTKEQCEIFFRSAN